MVGVLESILLRELFEWDNLDAIKVTRGVDKERMKDCSYGFDRRVIEVESYKIGNTPSSYMLDLWI